MDDQAGAQLESASSQSPSEVAGNQEACALPAPAAVPAESLMAPPPAKQAQVQNPTPAGSKGARAREAAKAAALSAAAHAAPAQRERIIAEATSAALAKIEAEERQQALTTSATAENGMAKPSTTPPAAAASYNPPTWRGAPEGILYTLEVMKSGAILSKKALDKKDHWTFGRHPRSDFVLEHPSASRLHAVLQFRGQDAQGFLFDAGSAHGSFVNKQRLTPREHVPIRVGDVLRFGQSTRLYLYGGPEELMPEEGLTKSQRKQAALLEAKERRKEREAQISKAQMDIAISGGVSWGMGGDAADDMDDDDEPAGGTVDWRMYSQTHTLTDKQQKIATKLRRLENRVMNLSRELERIRAKQTSYEELSAGQASQMARNETEIDRSTEEMEDLEETLNESIAESIKSRQRQADKATGKPVVKKRRRADDEEDEEAARGSSDEDEFYDRTVTGGQKKQKRQLAKKPPPADDAATIYGRKEALAQERQHLQQQLVREEAASAAAAPKLQEAAAHQVEEASPSAASAAAGNDSLDAFMSSMDLQTEVDKVEKLRAEVRDLDARILEAETLLRFADPENYFRTGTRAAAEARSRGLRQHAAERQRAQEEAERARAKKEEAAAAVEEMEEDEPAGTHTNPVPLHAQAAAAAAAAAGSSSEPTPPSTLTPSAGGPAAIAEAVPTHTSEAARNPDQPISANEQQEVGGLEIRQRPAPAGEAAGGDPLDGSEVGGLQIRQRPTATAAADAGAPSVGAAGRGSSGMGAAKSVKTTPGGLPGVSYAPSQQSSQQPSQQLLTREQIKAGRRPLANGASPAISTAGMSTADDQVLEDMAVLSRARASAADSSQPPDSEDGPAAATAWKPPEGQQGDGRTKLNDLLGY